jgi:hypothetical protein
MFRALTSQTKKLTLLVVLALLIVISSIVVFVQFGGSNVSSAESSSPSSSASTSPVTHTSTSSSSSIPGTSTFIGFSQPYTAFYVTPTVPMNYSITISQFDTTGRNVTVSVTSTVSGVSVTATPNKFTFIGDKEAVGLTISVAQTVNSTILPVEIVARTATGATNQSFDFRLNKALIVVLPDAGLTPRTLHVAVGQGVVWLNLLDPGDEGNGQANVLLSDGTPASPTLELNDLWSHAFTIPGTYTYQVTLNGYTTQNGDVVVG